MAHPRKLIRDAVVQLLAAGATAAGSRVWPGRYRRLSPQELPALLVYCRQDEAGRRIADAPRLYGRELRLVVAAVVAGTGALDDQLDDLAREVEVLLENNETLGGLCLDLVYAGTRLEVDADVDPPVGQAEIEWLVTYEDDLKTPVADDFLEADVTWNIPGTPDTEEAQDTIQL
ncbi:hypothetical protein G3N55_00110 [Dissulfurirhabdus thermomarina]|uniref:Uncharacterized protein n=1 Tax=Dissulfurirhabdus thermomarina TaxID=1765737 RepID=A0A6N9TMF1_DISTH|nr:hypothetical protein [Dissulfurirhabdus thermomarina]NDY41253.1 hypothetical protein [Dissulfurirhabdus thermomarina]